MSHRLFQKLRSTQEKKAKKSWQVGLTLIEMLVVILISSIVLLALLSLYSEGQKYFFNQGAKADTIEDSRYPVAWITRDIRGGSQVVATITLDGQAYSTGTNSIVIQIPSIDAAGALIDYTSVFDYIIYRPNSQVPSRLERIIKPDISSFRNESTRILADNVGAFSLDFFDLDGNTVGNYADTAIVNISIVSNKSGIGRSFQESVSTQAKLRNKAVS